MKIPANFEIEIPSLGRPDVSMLDHLPKHRRDGIFGHDIDSPTLAWHRKMSDDRANCPRCDPVNYALFRARHRREA